MPITDDRKRELARMHHETNDRAVKRYFDEIQAGKSEDEARDIVKAAFSKPDFPYGDVRLDRALTTRAGQFAPGSIAEIEGKVLTHIARCELDVQRIRRFYEGQLDDIARRRDAGADWIDIEMIEQTGGKFEGTKYKRVPLAEAERKILQALVETNDAFWNAVKATKADTVINIRADNLQTHTPEELDMMLRELKGNYDKGEVS